jgi:hypothetical protein
MCARSIEMPLPEQVLMRRRLQVLGDDQVEHAADSPEKDRWVKDFIHRLARAIRNIGRRQSMIAAPQPIWIWATVAAMTLCMAGYIIVGVTRISENSF